MSDRVKFEMEFPIKASQKLLFQYISTPSGLSEWFADNVNSRGEIFIFIWDGSEEKAKLLQKTLSSFLNFAYIISYTSLFGSKECIIGLLKIFLNFSTD